MNYDNSGKISMWKNEGFAPEGDRPWVRGILVAHRDIKAGEELDLSLWINRSENPKAPKLTGRLQDKYQAAPAAPVAAPEPAMIDDDIPF